MCWVERVTRSWDMSLILLPPVNRGRKILNLDVLLWRRGIVTSRAAHRSWWKTTIGIGFYKLFLSEICKLSDSQLPAVSCLVMFFDFPQIILEDGKSCAFFLCAGVDLSMLSFKLGKLL